MIYINARFLTQRITGVQRFAIELSLRLKSAGLKVVFVAPKGVIHKELAKQFEVKLIGNRSGHMWEQIDLPIFLKSKDSPYLLNLCNTGPLFYKKSIVTIHDLAFLENPKWFSKSFYFFYKHLIPRIAKNAIHILSVSNFSRDEIVSRLGIDKNKISVLNNAVSSSFECNESINIEEEFVLFVGSLDPRKNMKNLLDSFKYFPKGLKLKVVGGAALSFSDKEQKNILKDKNIEFLGYVSDDYLINLYRNATCFIYPSLYEGFGIPPLEAQSLGTPVVLSDISVFKEVFGDSVYYCDPYSPKSIASTIQDIYFLLEEERTKIITLGKINSKQYSWEKSASMLIELLKNHQFI